jgi:hypothetical protein
VCGPNGAGVKEDRHSGNAKRLECAELAPAFGVPTLNDSASKLDALQTLRAQERKVFAITKLPARAVVSTELEVAGSLGL